MNKHTEGTKTNKETPEQAGDKAARAHQANSASATEESTAAARAQAERNKRDADKEAEKR